ARKRIEGARAAVAALAGVAPEQVIFTSGGSEANNLALRGSDAASLIVGATEHEAVLQPAHGAGLPMRLLPVLADGRADLAALER
ncbi:aminotransferase class V-fold PLP-dependent enzyme, partial [Acinetobacter baumannii]